MKDWTNLLKISPNQNQKQWYDISDSGLAQSYVKRIDSLYSGGGRYCKPLQPSLEERESDSAY